MNFLFLNSHAHLLLEENTASVSGGAELQVALLARELACRGHTVTIIGGDRGGDQPRTLAGVRCLPGGRFHTGRLADTLRSIPIVVRLIRQQRPDHVAILGWTTWVFLLALLAPFLRYQFAFICGLDTEINGEFRRAHPVKGALLDYGVRLARHRFAMSDHQAQLFARRRLPASLYRNLVLPRAQPLPDNLESTKDTDLLWVARCQPIKRPHAFLDLVAALPHRRCLMVCPSEHLELWNSVATRAATLPNLQFIPFIPYHQIQATYDRAQIFVNTSEWEGFANSFIQAGLARAAILSLSVDCDNVLRDFHAGLCANNNPAELHRLAEHLLTHPEELRPLQDGAQRFVEQRHATDTNTDAFLAGLSR